MSSSFKPGQMVSPMGWMDEPLDLFNMPGGAKNVQGSDDIRKIGTLNPKDVALLVAIERADGGSVYVFGPRGGGWTFGAFLKVVRDVTS